MVELKFKDIESLNAVTGALHKNGYKYSTFVVWRCGEVSHFTVQIEEAHTVDAVEVVRCKDCKNYFYSSFSMGMKCRLDGTEWGKDDFCSCGERKDNA